MKIIILIIEIVSYAFALFRDEINAQEDCNADILIEQANKDDNPHKRKFVENNEKYLGLSGGRNNETKYGREWNEKYQLGFNWSRLL